MSPKLLLQLKAARRCSVPLVAITTPDPAATIQTVCDSVNGGNGQAAVKIVWDAVEGLRPRGKNDSEIEACKKVIANLIGENDDPTKFNPTVLLSLAKKLPEESMLFMHLANRFIPDIGVIQAIWNLRDEFKINHRMLIMLAPAIDLPPELSGDVIVFDEPLPDEAELAQIIKDQYESGKLKPDPHIVPKGVEAIQGLPAFQAEQVVAMSLGKGGLNISECWERKRRQIEQTPGLKVNREPVQFSDIGGVKVIKEFLRRILAGNGRPNAIVFVDEIEKFIAGSSGQGADTSGVSQDQLGTLLSYMQDNSAAGCIFVGPPGSAKSMVAKAAGNEAAGGAIPTIQLDLGAMKGSLVGQSEQNLRAGLKVITSVSNSKSLWIATCNSISDLPPELRRRFTLGTFFFDLPDASERETIWKIYLTKYDHPKKQLDGIDDSGWTGAEIMQCCDIAHRLNGTLVEASGFVVPVSRSAADQLERLRKGADGRFLSASRLGVYRRAGDSASQSDGKQKRGRALAMEEA